MATKHPLNSSTQSDQCCTSKLNLDGTGNKSTFTNTRNWLRGRYAPPVHDGNSSKYGRGSALRAAPPTATGRPRRDGG